MNLLGRTTLRLCKSAQTIRHAYWNYSISLNRFMGTVDPSSISQNILRSPFPDVDLPKGNVVIQIINNAALHSDKVAMECGLTGARYTYGQMIDSIAKWSGFMERLGISQGDIVAIVSPNCLEYPIALFGALSRGIIVTTINSTYTSYEIADQLKESQPKLVVGSASLESQIHQALEMYGQPLHLVLIGQGRLGPSINFHDIIMDNMLAFAEPAQLTGDEIALLPCSSGTTGKPKCVALTHNALAVNLAMVEHPATFTLHPTSRNTQETLMGLLPFFHGFGLFAILSIGLHWGARIVILPKLDPYIFIRTIKDHKVK